MFCFHNWFYEYHIFENFKFRLCLKCDLIQYMPFSVWIKIDYPLDNFISYKIKNSILLKDLKNGK